MLCLVGGCGRSGKSSLAERMRVRHGVPWFPLDALKMGLHLGAASLGVHPDDDDLETADRMWPIVKAALENLVFDGRNTASAKLRLAESRLSEGASWGLSVLNGGGRAYSGAPEANRLGR
jgi:hypothetical protein